MFRRAAYSLLALMMAYMPAHADPIITGSIPNTFTPGSTISSSQMNANFQYITNQVNANAAKNGANSSITSLSALSTPLSPAAGATNIYIGGTSTGAANVQVVATAIPTGYSLLTGYAVRFVSGFTNTGPTTLAVNSTTATNIFRQTPLGLQALTGGELVTGQAIEVYYDGTQYELISGSAQYGGYSTLSGLAAAATTDLGTMPTHNVLLTGVATTITSFGSSANTVYPVYLVRFNAAHTLTNSANLNLLNGASRITGGGDQGTYIYNGAGVWYEIAYNPFQIKVGPVTANSLYMRNNGATPNTKIDITAAEVVMDNGSGGNFYTDTYGSCTVDLTVNGAAGLDTGAIAASTWYYVYAISTGTTTSCLASVSASAPTMPAGYTFKMRLGAMITTAGSIFYRTQQRGRDTRFVATAGASPTTTGLQLAFGIQGTCSTTSTWVALALTVPTTAIAVDVALHDGGNNAGMAPNNAVANYQLTSMVHLGTATASAITSRFLLESYNVYVCSAAAAAVMWELGWVDAVNAN